MTEVVKITPKKFEDERGFFSEIFNNRDYKKFGICMEVGAADGIDQSNSLLLERLYDCSNQFHGNLQKTRPCETAFN